jgi:3-oxoacyl-[acyl-carrier-protein] synthase-3
VVGVSVIFGDGAGAAVLSREEDLTKGILSTHLHSEGQHAEELALLHQEWEQDGFLIL